ncbi:MAG: thioredoxin family protein [Candidatus Pacebacteria bacterium]|nr:TM0996/MTH895 family glutaredoxin-like protein [Candidatus Parcubacteria bacterium]MDD3072738.1 thioredoxin family protein [Candidatus Paceibacterota bacterium]HPA25854.1 thioredoxin family protein [bacterium]MDD3729345.1 thioredoxin family protein [Candidatus Paceibacterota bacterium]MDD4201520.1 thioredoxin family protein [Candidatus Paceibacterota bacterium]
MKNSDKIQVLGSGCPTCKKLFELTKQAVQELGIKTEVEYITDIQKIIEMGVMQSPVLAINGKPVMTGSVSDIEKIKELITKETTETTSENKPACSCGGNC